MGCLYKPSACPLHQLLKKGLNKKALAVLGLLATLKITPIYKRFLGKNGGALITYKAYKAPSRNVAQKVVKTYPAAATAINAKIKLISIFVHSKNEHVFPFVT